MIKGVIKPRAKNKFGDMGDSANYREVMSSSMFMKIFEYLLLPYVTEHCRVSTAQYGYRPCTSTTLAVATFKETVYSYINEGSTVYSCFLDMSKAFERINHRKLLQKLDESTLPRFVINALNIMLSSGAAEVSCHGKHSEEWDTVRGTRQGGILSAHLFSIYIDQILREISEEDFGCYLGINKINVQAYADDLVIFCPTSGGLRHLISKFTVLATQHNLVINDTKTKILIFHKKRTPHEHVEFCIDGQEIELVNNYKYLGTILSFNLKDHEDIRRLQSSFNRKVGVLLRKFHAVDLDVKMKLFNALCMDMYGIDLWWDTSGCVRTQKQFAVSYHYALKRILGFPKWESNHYACYILNQLTFEHLMVLKKLKFYRWLTQCSSPCFIINKHYFLNNSLLKSKLDDIFYEKYQVSNFIENDFDALVSRLFFVQIRENSSWNIGSLYSI